MKDKKFGTVNCYYCGRLVRIDKAIVLYVSPKIKPEGLSEGSAGIIQTAPVKIYICPACARYRGISRKDLKSKAKEQDILKKLGIEV